MDFENNNKKKISEFDQYMISPVVDEELTTPQMYAGITIGLSYLFILSSIVFMFLSIFNKDLLNPDLDNTLYEVIAQIIAGVIVVVSTCLIIGKNKLTKILKGFNGKNLGRALTFVGIAWIALILVSYIELALFGTNENSSSNQDSLVVIMSNYKLLSFIFIVIMAPIVEEIIFRYFIFRGLQGRVKTVVAFVITVSTFAGIHYLASIMEGTLLEDLKSILGYVVPSFIMTYLYYKNKNLATPIMFHMIFNGLQWLLMLNPPTNPEGSISSSIQCILNVLIS